jgi:hypothetical protein
LGVVGILGQSPGDIEKFFLRQPDKRAAHHGTEEAETPLPSG